MYDIRPIAKHLHIHFTIHIEFDEYEEQYGECQQRRASVREKRQGDTDNGHYAEHHTDIYDKMKSSESIFRYHSLPSCFGKSRTNDWLRWWYRQKALAFKP